MSRLAALALGLAALAATVAPPSRAEACGGFFVPRAGMLPSIAVERVLLVHDEDAGVEHFVRELAFANANQPFGFVVPTPSRPGVFRVDELPWGGLERAFPFEEKGKGSGQGFGSGHGRLGGAGVRVLEAKPLGSFAAYVLQATDGNAMKGWLDRNHFTTTPASAAWLERYVKLGFYFVALRYDPGLHRAKVEREGRNTSAETLRISFATPAPYFPYREPDRDDLGKDRALALWLVTKGKPRVPVALVQEGDSLAYRRPWREGHRQPPVPASSLAHALGEKTWKDLALPGEGDWNVQVFEDQKHARRGFGDVLLVPEEPGALDAAALEKHRALLPLLDPALEAP
jgi:hypothetical protein